MEISPDLASPPPHRRFPWHGRSLATIGTPIDALDLWRLPGGPGARLRAIRDRAPVVRRELASTGTPDQITTCELVSLPYPTRFGLFRATRALAPFLTITNRMLVVRWTERGGRKRTLLFEPSDHELGRNTPYFAALAKRIPEVIAKRIATERGSVLLHLARLGIAPDEVDYLLFDHLHTQDVRRWLGTTVEQRDLGPVRAAFPNAKLIVQRDELAAIADLHPVQQPWYQVETYRDLPPAALLAIDGSVLLGPGVAVIATPGHVCGNQSLVLNTSTGIWVSSENVIATEALTPEHSRLPGLARWATRWGQEVVLNANTLENTAEQYNAVVLEKLLCDPSPRDGRFLQFFPSSELTAMWTNPGTTPTFTHGHITHTR